MAQTTECKACKKEVAIDAKTCPHCGQRNPGHTWKESMQGCLFLIIFAVIVIFILAIVLDVTSHK